MAIVLYKCDVCKRDIEIIQNVRGLETPQRCVITHGCRGKLYQEKVLVDFVRGSLPADVTGLDNYQQRKVLYNHTQSIENQEWVIQHNLGTAPSVSVFVSRPSEADPDGTLEILPTDTIIESPDVIRLVFDRPESGLAQLVARASDPNLLQPFVREAATSLELNQVTAFSEFTIATRTSAPLAEPAQITIQLVYVTTGGIEVPIVYAADDQPSAVSPWNDTDRLIVNGKVFTTRSFNIIVAQQLSGVITNGSTVRLGYVDDGSGERSVVANELIFLLADSPYDNVDRRTTTYIDGVSVQGDDNPFAFFFDGGELVADETILQGIHPPIRSI
jgi:hypothetical protein